MQPTIMCSSKDFSQLSNLKTELLQPQDSNQMISEKSFKQMKA